MQRNSSSNFMTTTLIALKLPNAKEAINLIEESYQTLPLDDQYDELLKSIAQFEIEFKNLKQAMMSFGKQSSIVQKKIAASDYFIDSTDGSFIASLLLIEWMLLRWWWLNISAGSMNKEMSYLETLIFRFCYSLIGSTLPTHLNNDNSVENNNLNELGQLISLLMAAIFNYFVSRTTRLLNQCASPYFKKFFDNPNSNHEKTKQEFELMCQKIYYFEKFLIKHKVKNQLQLLTKFRSEFFNPELRQKFAAEDRANPANLSPANNSF